MSNLLRIRGSGWSEETRKKEDPAGMGFFCLCRMNNLMVRSKGRQVFMGNSCEALKGLNVAVVEFCHDYVDGTELEFDWPSISIYQLRDAITSVGRYAPIKVTIDGEPIKQESIKPKLVLREFENEDVKVYIYQGVYGARLMFNFHGLLIDDEFPNSIKDFCATVDVKDTSKLQMVLPARNAIVRNIYYRELLEEIQRTIYETIKDEKAHDLPYRCWQEAKSLGVDLPPANQELKKRFSDLHRVIIDSSRTPLIMNSLDFRGKFESLAAAIEQDGIYCLYEEDRSMSGYEWYDAIQKVTNVHYEKDGNLLNRIDYSRSASGLGIIFVLDWNDESPIVLKAPILIGNVVYGDEIYSEAVSRAGGFYIDTEFNCLDEARLCKLIDSAWQTQYLNDSQRREWNRQRTLDVRRCIGNASAALEHTIRDTIQDALSQIDDLSSYAGSVITVQCTVDESGNAKIASV
jgi:hypothetical protein